MRRSGSQKALFVFSIIEIVCAVLLLFGGLLAAAGAGVADSGALFGELASKGQGEGAILFSSAAVVFIVLGIWGLLCGVFGMWAANDSKKIMIVWAFLLIGLALDAVGVAWSVVDGSFEHSPGSLVICLVVDFVLFWIAGNIKREAGK